MLHARYHNVYESKQRRYLIQSRSQANIHGIILPKGHGIDKEDQNVKPEKQK